MVSKRRASRASEQARQIKKPKTHDEESLYAFFRSTLALVRELKDDTRPIKTEFLKLPSKKLYPDYYTRIENPISLEEIKEKIVSHEYRDTDEFVSDFRLMAENAAEYNMRESIIAQDAEKMYNLVKEQAEHFEAGDPSADPLNVKLKLKKAEEELEDFLDQPIPPFRQKLLALLARVMAYEHDGEMIAEVFREEPLKKLYPDYYTVISRPMAFNTLNRNLGGKKGPKYFVIDDLVQDVKLMWKNAQTYNEEGSLIYKYSQILSDRFDQELSALAEVEGFTVGKPKGLKLRLKPPVEGKRKGRPPKSLVKNEEVTLDQEEILAEAGELPPQDEQQGITSPGIVRVPREKDGSFCLIREISVMSTRLKPGRTQFGHLNPEAQLSNAVFQTWFEYQFVAGEHRIPNYSMNLPVFNTVTNRGAVTVFATLSEDLEGHRYEHTLCVNNEKVKATPSVTYSDDDKMLTSRYDLKLVLGLNNVRISVRVLKDNILSSGINSENILTGENGDLPEEHINLWINVCQ